MSIIYDGDDAAADWFPEGADWDTFPPSYDEWLALRYAIGLGYADFTDYLSCIDFAGWYSTAAMTVLEQSHD